ncbi:DNA polymerase IV [Thermobifida halotolerans]|uniref:DNA polymerase IV n=1 Tax=Thermobifida halotolerans TaxID=483545 RepID=A0A399G9T4_9ACTN|nr:DNA polymerase IV [Thermobifida halotolerans]UOE21817.1 DNA polymerase IV [Thermobifida halotolerans]
MRGVMTEHGIAPLTGQPVDDADCTVLHIDMDAFFTSVEELRRPEVRGRPVIVGGTGARGVVAAANYPARRHGVHSAMPMARALRLCPGAVVFPPDGETYRRVSARVMDILRSITPQVERLSVDEAFLDVAGAHRRLGGGPEHIARLVRARVRAEEGLTCSVGVAATKFVAKLASTRCKPDGLLLVPTAHVTAFLHPLPVGALWGVGDRTEQALRRMGLRTVGDVAHTPPDTLRHELGQALGGQLAELAWGRDPRPVTAETTDKSVSTEETFDTDIRDPEAIRRELLRLAEKVARRLRAGGHAGRTVGVKLRRSDFGTVTRSRTLSEPTDVAREIFAVARELYAASGLPGTPLRLVGIRMEGLVPADQVHHQLALDEHEQEWRTVERLQDEVVRRFGSGALGPASLAFRDEDDV